MRIAEIVSGHGRNGATVRVITLTRGRSLRLNTTLVHWRRVATVPAWHATRCTR
jgi:hypothetical protein